MEALGVGPVVDELALDLGDGALLARQFVDAGWLGAEVLRPLQALDDLLKAMSGAENAPLWDVSSLSTSPRWAAARDQAKQVLLAIQ